LLACKPKPTRRKRKLEELREAGDEAWEELKAGIENAWDDLRTAMQNALARIK
jgi:hypothetical protein